MNSDTDFIFIGAGFGFHGEGDRRFGKLYRLIKDVAAIFFAERVAGNGFLQLGNCADIASMEFLNFSKLFSLHQHGVLEALRQITIEVLQRGVVFEDAGLHLEIIDAPGEGISQRFEDENGEWLIIVVLAINAIPLTVGLFETDLGVLVGMRENVGEESKQAGITDIATRRNHQHRNNFFGDDSFAHRGN